MVSFRRGLILIVVLVKILNMQYTYTPSLI